MNQIATVNTRLPYHPQLEEKLNVTSGQWAVLCDAVFPNVENASSIILALNYCKSRNLDIFKRPVQIVPIWNSKLKRMVDTVWPGISELRTTASRTKNYAGMDRAEFGPDVTEVLGNTSVTYPEWCAVTVYRVVAGVRCAFVGPAVYWKETYATAKRDTTAPNSMWAKRPRGQLEKCAEAAALRRAFPEELGNEFAAEEMEGQGLREASVEKVIAPDPFAQTEPTTEDVEEAEIETVEAEEVIEPSGGAAEPDNKPQQWPVFDDAEEGAEKVAGAIQACDDDQCLRNLWEATRDARAAIEEANPITGADLTNAFKKRGADLAANQASTHS